MSIDIRLPNITGSSDTARLAQIQSYIYQLAQQLNWALNTMESDQETAIEVIKSSSVSPKTDAEAQETFDAIKQLIIKSADIVQAYEDKISVNLQGQYVAQSDFGIYKSETAATIEANSTSITQHYTELQTVETDVTRMKQSEAYIKTGKLSDTEEIYGLEIGQTDDSGTFNKFSRFTASGLYFYLGDQSNPIAWMEGEKLYINNAEITSSLRLGGYYLDLSSGITFKWQG